ncbi:isopentenyl-diphosphate Delta-isomerase [Corynebacterium glaucum]|uniref:isopentenyl-diphosphate Delta-isomerase n=1 Tax=Corynebacterium glaucum TaxID=187491 RepID=UPI0018DF164D|nr:isopentenyl-diphosphate Delta-isomerase [Corynebacterium glaucum]
MIEQVVLVDDLGNAIGTANKSEVHTADTPLHLAFSCWLFNADGELLMTRRALSKLTWPGVWTNSFCGHPAPGEATEEAVYRRAQVELGIAPEDIAGLELAVTDFRYRAVDSSGIVEHEICPVYVAQLRPDAQVGSNPDEVDSLAWVVPATLRAAAESAPFVFSPWLVEELAQPGLRAYV